MSKKMLPTLLHGTLVLCTLATAQTTRNVYDWPFSKYSIWNMPIGSNAQYVAANMPVPDTYAGDIDYIHFNSSATPRVVTSRSGGSIGVDDGHIVRAGDSRNKVVNIFPKDGYTFQSIQPGDRSSTTGDFTGYLWRGSSDLYPNMNTIEMRGEHQDLRGFGIAGAHWGSGMNGVAASIRPGDLLNDTPIRHALGIEVSGWKVIYHDKNDNSWNIATGDFTKWGFRWPADRMDGCAGYFKNGDGNTCYYGTNSAVRMGALFAIPPNLNCENLGLQTKAAKKMCWTMQNYGAYLIDDSYGMNSGKNIVNFAYLPGVNEEFTSQYGYPFDIGWNEGANRQKPFFKDLDILVTKLSVIVNNGPNSIGGGGNPRQCLAPSFANGVQDLVASNPNGSVVEPANCDNPVFSSSSSTITSSSSAATTAVIQNGTVLEAELAILGTGNGTKPSGVVAFNDVGEYIYFPQIEISNTIDSVLVTYGVPSPYQGNIAEFRLGSTSGTLVGSLTLQSTTSWEIMRTDATALSPWTGAQDLYVVFKQGTSSSTWIGDFDKFTFQSAESTTRLRNLPVWLGILKQTRSFDILGRKR